MPRFDWMGREIKGTPKAYRAKNTGATKPKKTTTKTRTSSKKPATKK